MTQERARGKSGRVLIVDDEQAVRDLLEAILGGRYECVAVADAEAALAALAAAEFDVVLTDILMTGRSGLALCGLIRERWRQTPVVIVSGIADREEALQAGAIDYIRKPFSVFDILEVVERAAAHKAANPPPSNPPHG